MFVNTLLVDKLIKQKKAIASFLVERLAGVEPAIYS